jgi:hypothetical protein
MGKNTKKRDDDRRGYREWTPEQREKVRKSSMRYPFLNDKEWLTEQYVVLKKTTVQIAKEVGCVPSTVYVALERYNVSPRSISEARQGIVFSEEHLQKVTRANREKALCGSSHWNWQGGKTSEYEDLIHDINNGKCLCCFCHRALHEKDGELLGHPERTISSQARVGTPLKVQRLTAESRPDSNADTSAVPERDDIVCSSWEHEGNLG